MNNFFTLTRTKNNQQTASGNSSFSTCLFFWYILSGLYPKRQCSLVSYSAVTKSKIIWDLKVVDSGFSISSNDIINNVFYALFCDSPTASEFSVARTKTMYQILIMVLHLYVKSLVINSLSKPLVYTYSWWELKRNNWNFTNGFMHALGCS